MFEHEIEVRGSPRLSRYERLDHVECRRHGEVARWNVKGCALQSRWVFPTYLICLKLQLYVLKITETGKSVNSSINVEILSAKELLPLIAVATSGSRCDLR